MGRQILIGILTVLIFINVMLTGALVDAKFLHLYHACLPEDCDCTATVASALTAVGHAPVPQQVFWYLPPGKTGSVREFAGLQKGDDGIPVISGMWEGNKTTLRIPQPTGWTVDRFVSEVNYALQKYKGKGFEVERGVDQTITFYEARIDKRNVIATFAPFVTAP